MTVTEAKAILKTRIGWKDDKTVSGFVVSAENLVSDSGLYYQGEHPAITLQNIRDTQPVPNISDDNFNAYLNDLREQASVQVLSDVFERDTFSDSLLTLYPRAFDHVLRLRMAITVGELIMTSTRSNKIARLTDEFVGKLNYDLFRDTVQKFANSARGYRHSMAVSEKYDFHIASLQRRFGNQRNMIKVISKGETTTLYPPDLDNDVNPMDNINFN